jgi:serine/threonine protein kinase
LRIGGGPPKNDAAASLGRIAQYELQETLGFGALGTVYRAWDTKLNRTVALKVLSSDIEDLALRERFHMEARAIAALQHPNIVSVLDYSDAESETQYMALEHLEGKALADLVREYGPVTEHVALCIGRDVAAAAEYAHGQAVVHRDIKPENVVLEGGGRVVLIDFGAMKLTQSHRYIPETDVEKATLAIGTPGFMAPEQFLGQAVDHRVDVYAIGALLYNATTGSLPYARGSDDVAQLYKAAKQDRCRDPRDLQPLLTPGFCDLLADCMALSPADRIADATKLRQRIEALLAAHGIENVQEVLPRYCETPELDQEYDLRSVDTLTRELKLALLRDLQRAIKRQDDMHIRDATNRLRYVYRLFDDAEKFFLLDGREKPRLLRGRLLRRGRWFSLGLLGGAALAAALAIGFPQWAQLAHLALTRLGK